MARPLAPSFDGLLASVALVLLYGCSSVNDPAAGGHVGDLGVSDAGAEGCSPPCDDYSYCAEDGACHPGCALDEHCTAPLLCDPATHSCVERACVVDAHCPADAPRCYAADGRCGCGRAEDCPFGEACNPLGWCVPEGRECAGPSQCGAEQVCTAEGWCVPQGRECAADRHCGAGLVCTERGYCLTEGLECEADAHCGSGEVCSELGFCVGEGHDCVPGTEDQCPSDTRCKEPGFCVTQGRDCDISGHCAAGERCDDASGDCVPTEESCQATGCPRGEECNRFGRCVSVGQECTRDEHCPGEERCRLETGFCVPDGLECNDPGDCGDAELQCNPFGACVPRIGALLLCAACERDGDCGAPDGVCLGPAYLDGQGEPLEHPQCVASCDEELDCPHGMTCAAYTRGGRSAGACVPRSASCSAWITWERDCQVDLECGEGGICRDLHYDFSLDTQCTWACATAEDCPSGVDCGGLGFCRYGE